jgi:hypothetical protein
MKKSIVIFAFMAMGLFTKPVFAQFNDAYFNMYYSMGLGVGDTKIILVNIVGGAWVWNTNLR